MEDKTSCIFPTLGWKQFLIGRKKILDSYNNAKVFSQSHKVQTSHGNVAEAELREWLINFLPIKYGVTSGYIISQLVSDKMKTPHYDVIIYDALNSPILWIEDNNDNSSEGKSRAIPAEYVKAVFEIKSSFEKTTAQQAIQHIKELSYLYQNVDKPNDIYKQYLPSDFFCASIFMELREEHASKDDILSDDIIKAYDIRGYYGTIILSGENVDPTKTCLIKESADFKIEPSFLKGKGCLRSNIYRTNTIQIEDKTYPPLHLTWEDLNFSTFAFDVLAKLNGTYREGYRSSFYVCGDNSWKV